MMLPASKLFLWYSFWFVVKLSEQIPCHTYFDLLYGDTVHYLFDLSMISYYIYNHATWVHESFDYIMRWTRLRKYVKRMWMAIMKFLLRLSSRWKTERVHPYRIAPVKEPEHCKKRSRAVYIHGHGMKYKNPSRIARKIKLYDIVIVDKASDGMRESNDSTTNLAMKSTLPSKDMMSFDSDSTEWGIDTYASKCISYDKKDFVGAIANASAHLDGIGGGLKIDGVGTLRLKITDDEGKHHEIYISDSLYVKDSKRKLISPQHWSKMAGDGDGTWCATYADRSVLYWNNNRHSLTVPMNTTSNVPIFHSTAGCYQYCTYAAVADKAKGIKDKEFVACRMETRSDFDSAQLKPQNVGVKLRLHISGS